MSKVTVTSADYPLADNWIWRALYLQAITNIRFILHGRRPAVMVVLPTGHFEFRYLDVPPPQSP